MTQKTQSEGELAARSVTMQDIADRCGVTKMTVSWALRGTPGKVRKEKREWILEVAREMGYDPSSNYSARRLASRKSAQRILNHGIALFFPGRFHRDPFHWYFTHLLESIMDTLMAEGFGLLLHYNQVSDDCPLLPFFARGDIDGAIVIGNPEHFAPRLKQLRSTVNFGNRPIVSIMNPMPGCSEVLVDDVQGGYAAAAHLLDLGHRHLLHFTPNDNYQHHKRHEGYQRAYQERGLEPDTYLHKAPDWEHIRKARAEELLTVALQQYPQTTGILARHDGAAIWITEFLERRGLHVPRDMSVIGFDDTDPLPGEYGQNILTSVRIPLEQVGEQCGRLVIDRVTGKVPQDITITLPTEFVERGTTAPPRRRTSVSPSHPED